MHALLVTSDRDVLTAVADLVGAGQPGCLMQEISAAELQDGLRRAQVALIVPIQAADAPDERLTQNERDVLALMQLGWSSREMAMHLGQTVPAVKASLTALYRRMGARLR